MDNISPIKQRFDEFIHKLETQPEFTMEDWTTHIDKLYATIEGYLKDYISSGKVHIDYIEMDEEMKMMEITIIDRYYTMLKPNGFKNKFCGDIDVKSLVSHNVEGRVEFFGSHATLDFLLIRDDNDKFSWNILNIVGSLLLLEEETFFDVLMDMCGYVPEGY
jgi:hypothetical protein